MVEKIILDADICVKLGGSGKYRILYEFIPLLAENAYIHKTTYEEIMYPPKRNHKLTSLFLKGKFMLYLRLTWKRMIEKYTI